MPETRAWCCLIALVGLCVAAPGAPQPGAAAASPDDLEQQIQSIRSALPLNLFAHPTAQDEAKGIEGCRLYALAAKRLGELADKVQSHLGHMGVRAGFCAGDPATMLAGAQLLWSKVERNTNAGAAAASMLTWAGILAGDRAAALAGIAHLAAHPPTPEHAQWARSLKPLAQTCDKPVQLDFKLLDGQRVRSSKLRGHAVVLDFWATWCAPCRRVIPDIRTFYNERKDDKNFLLIGVSSDTSKGDARRGAREHGMKWPQAMDQGLGKEFRIRGIPHMIVLGVDGRLIYRGHPAAMDQIKWAADFARRQARRMAAKPKPAPADPPKPVATPAPAPTSKPAPKPREADPTPQTPEAMAAQKLRLARAYLNAGMKAKAKAIFSEIVRDYPATSAAKQARAELAK